MFDSDMVASLAFYLNHRRRDARLQLAQTKRWAQEDSGVIARVDVNEVVFDDSSVPAARAAAYGCRLDQPFLTVADVARILQLNQQTVRNWIAQRARGTFIEHGGKIEAFVPRVSLSVVSATVRSELSRWTRTMFGPGMDARPTSVRATAVAPSIAVYTVDVPLIVGGTLRSGPTHASEPGRTGDVHALHRDSLFAVNDHNADGMLMIDHGGVVLLANRAAEPLLGRPGRVCAGRRSDLRWC